MKIYQIHETGGSYEDYYDILKASYLSKEKAEKHLEELNDKLAQMILCDNCPIYYCRYNCDIECGTKECDDFRIESTIKYCKNFCITYEESDNEELELCCKNRMNERYDNTEYEIREVEVIE